METATKTKERPILFSGPMVRAILEGQKTQTRRVVKPQPIKQHHIAHLNDPGWSSIFHVLTNRAVTVETLSCPYGQLGDRLWVREPWAEGRASGLIYYLADEGMKYKKGACFDRWRPPIFMPKKHSRITLEVTGVRVERLHDISEEDARAEGVAAISVADVPRQAAWSDRQDFSRLWDSINAKRGFGWEKNPWVWVVEFGKCEPAK